MTKKKITGYVDTWRVLDKNGSPKMWLYRIIVNGRKKGFEEFKSGRDGRNKAVRAILKKNPGYVVRPVKDTQGK